MKNERKEQSTGQRRSLRRKRKKEEATGQRRPLIKNERKEETTGQRRSLRRKRKKEEATGQRWPLMKNERKEETTGQRRTLRRTRKKEEATDGPSLGKFDLLLERLYRQSLATVTPEILSVIASHKEGFGVVLLFLHMVKAMRLDFHYDTTKIDVSEFELEPGKLDLFLSSFLSSLKVSSNLKCGPCVCKERFLPTLSRFLHMMAERGGDRDSKTPPLQTLLLNEYKLDAFRGAALLSCVLSSLKDSELDLSGE
uniref:Uncharacterized protein n=1 Tax=Chromera velia CCMP2878 TaxID=1169474 RepID=A0A0G4HZ91_9ALVE|eukprot:Cvel_9680.t1-p1 / transcript=Cvel_9680.t1 / gene=Cvel_9680 / organism=Chromera_velia_CCMP2878 / gene_product=Protamine, putative / transcript_product=Protamine, putative / location=Cvel_scaffold564:12095-17796(-) / protein_length=253 / sequence_SO=supercontig / SO=protein_coding / is_pseudo=false